MTATVNNLSFPMLTPIKQNDAVDPFHCRFCALIFTTYDEYKSHTYRHFNTKSCPECHGLLIQICGDEWFCLHTTSNCQNNKHSHKFTAADHSDDDSGPLPVAIKMELQPDIEVDHRDEDGDVNNGFQTVFIENTNPDYLLTQNTQFNGARTQSKHFHSQGNGINEMVEDKDSMERKQYNRMEHDHGKKTFPCGQCGRTYSNRSNLAKHFKRHEHTESVSVPVEPLFGDMAEELIKMKKYRNIFTSNNQSIEQNDSIAVSSDEKRRRNRQIAQRNTGNNRVHPHRPTTVTCDICQKTSSRYYWIREHMLSKHSPKAKRRYDFYNSWKQPTLGHMCSVCGRVFPDRSNMRAHEKTHFGIKTPCTVCGKQFSYKTGLVKHMRVVHDKLRPHICNIDGCKWTFGQKGGLKKHQARRHGMVTQRNACPICSKEFPNSTYHLKRHLQAHANNTAKEYIPPIPSETKRQEPATTTTTTATSDASK